MEKFIKYLEILFENDNDQKPTNKDDEGFSYNNIHDECGHLDNNNDALDFLISSFSYFKLFISSFYNFFISFNEYSKYISNQIQIHMKKFWKMKKTELNLYKKKKKNL